MLLEVIQTCFKEIAQKHVLAVVLNTKFVCKLNNYELWKE